MGSLTPDQSRDARELALLKELLRNGIEHAASNGRILDRDGQGVAPGERVPAVRASNIEACIEGAERRAR